MAKIAIDRLKSPQNRSHMTLTSKTRHFLSSRYAPAAGRKRNFGQTGQHFANILAQSSQLPTSTFRESGFNIMVDPYAVTYGRLRLFTHSRVCTRCVAHVVRRSVPGTKPPLSSRPVTLCGGMLGVRVRREREIVISRWVYRQTYM